MIIKINSWHNVGFSIPGCRSTWCPWEIYHWINKSSYLRLDHRIFLSWAKCHSSQMPTFFWGVLEFYFFDLWAFQAFPCFAFASARLLRPRTRQLHLFSQKMSWQGHWPGAVRDVQSEEEMGNRAQEWWWAQTTGTSQDVNLRKICEISLSYFQNKNPVMVFSTSWEVKQPCCFIKCSS